MHISVSRVQLSHIN